MTDARTVRVTIGVPVRNGETYLEETLRSLLAQTMDGFVLVVGDNDSTDRTGQIVQDYATTDPRVRYVRHDRNIGAWPNYNFLFGLGDTELFRWHAADDVSLPTYLERAVMALDEHPDAAMAYCRTMDIDARGHPIGPYEDQMAADQPRAADRFIWVRRHLARCNSLYGVVRRSAAQRTHLFGNYPGADMIFLAELALYGKIIEVPDRLFHRRYHELASSAHSQQQVWQYLAPASARQRRGLREWHHVLGYCRAVHRARLSLGERRDAYLEVAGVVAHRRRALLREALCLPRHVLGHS